MKERLGMTEMRKLKNRMNFGEIEDDVNQCALGDNLGLINAKGELLFFEVAVKFNFYPWGPQVGI